ncbi:hypothetical protein OKW49_001032 [Paraburkholderia youngii]|uniref:hypothetical protein n=1 Tax=Paraburkholderia youngii TaxID=2782701 RepID=UPI003D1B1CD4
MNIDLPNTFHFLSINRRLARKSNASPTAKHPNGAFTRYSSFTQKVIFDDIN